MSNNKTYEIAFRLGASMNSSMRTAFAKANKNISNVNGNVNNLNKGSGVLKKTIGKLAVAVGTATVAVGLMSAGLGAAVSAADNFNSELNQIQASTNVSAKEMSKIKEISKNLYNQNLGENWTDVADAITKTHTVTNLTGKALETATGNAIVFRDVFGEDISESVKTTDTMMKNFGITNKQAFNLLAQGAKNGLNKSQELLDSANEYSPYFASLGFNANQMFDTFASGLASGAFNLDKVGDAVKEFNIRAKDGSKTTSTAFQMLNMDAGKMSQTFARGGPEAQKSFIKVVQAISKVKDPVKKNAIAVGLFGTQAEDLEKNVIAAMGNARKQFDMTKDTMESVKNVKYDSLGNAFQGIKRKIETGMIIPIGEKLLPYVNKFANFVSANIPKVQSFFSKLGSGISKNFGKLSPIFDYVGKKFVEVFSVIVNWWNSNGAELLANVKIVFQGIWAVIKFIMPAVLMIVSTILNNVKGVISGALNIIMGVFQIFAGLFTGDWSKLWQGVKNLLGGAVQFLWNLWNLLFIGKLVGSIKTIAKAFWGFLTGLKTQIFTNIQFYYNMFVTGFYKIGAGIISAIGKSIATILNVIKNAGTVFIQVFNTARTFGVNIFLSLVSAIRNLFTTFFGFIKTFLVSTINSGISTVKLFVGSIGNFLRGLVSTVVTIFGKIGSVMAHPFSTLKSVVINVVSAVRGLVSGLFNGVKGLGRGAINGLISAANALISGINGLHVKIPKWVPKIGGNTIGFSIPHIPMLASGGVTTGPTLAMIGEGAEQEAVLPLSKLEGLLSNPSPKNGGGGTDSYQFVYSPQYIIKGNADIEKIKQLDKGNQDDFEKRINKFKSDRSRLSLEGV